MIYFLIIFFVVSLVYMLFHLSLIENQRVLGIAILLLGIVVFMLYPKAITQNKNTVQSILSQPNLVVAIAVLQIFEALAMIFLTIVQLKSSYIESPKRWSTWIPIIPSFLFLTGLFFLQVYAFLWIAVDSFLLLALGFAILVSVGLWLGQLVIRQLYKKWESRAEIKLLTTLFQILLAMFLPIMAKGLNVPFTQLDIDLFSIAFTLGVICCLVGGGYYWHQRKNTL